MTVNISSLTVTFAIALILANTATASQPATIVTAYQAQTGSIEQTLNTVGRLTARQSIDITSLIDGRVASLTLKDGAFVEADAPLVMLDSREQSARVAETRAALHDSERQLEYMKQLIGHGAVSQDELEAISSQVETQKAALRAEEVVLSDYTIRAPFSGTLGLHDISLGARIQAGSVITTLDDLSDLNLTFELPENLLGFMQPGQQITAQSDAWPDDNFTGQVDAIDSRINPNSLTFRARVVLPNPDMKLRPGLFMQLQVPVAAPEALVVPVHSILYDGGHNFVFVIAEDNTVSRREVVTGRNRNGMMEVLSGLQVGEKIVDEGVAKVREGSHVTTLSQPTHQSPTGAAETMGDS